MDGMPPLRIFILESVDTALALFQAAATETGSYQLFHGRGKNFLVGTVNIKAKWRFFFENPSSS